METHFEYKLDGGFLTINIPEHVFWEVKLRLFHAMRNVFSSYTAPHVETRVVRRLLRVYEEMDATKSFHRLSSEDVEILNWEMEPQQMWFHLAVARTSGQVRSNEESFKRREEIVRAIQEVDES